MTDTAVLRGIGWMCLTALMWAATDTLAKLLGQSYPNLQVLWGRFFFNAVLIALLLGPRLPGTLMTRRLGLQLLRAALLVVTVGLIFLSFRYLSLVSVNAIFYVTPVLVTVLAIPLLGERVGGWIWVGVLLGFIGALLIIRPGAGVMQWAALLPLGAALSSALYQVLTRVVSTSDGAMTSVLYACLGGAFLTTVLLPFHWRTPDAGGWGMLVAIGITGAIAQLALVRALTLAAPQRIAPFHYTNLVWVTVFGFLVFDEIPDTWTLLGATVIATSGLLVLRRRTTG